MKRFFYVMLFVVAVSGIVVAQKSSTSGSLNASSQTSAQKQGRQVDLLAETQLAGQLQSALDARHAKVGDQVIFKTTEAIRQNGKVVVPKGAQLIGRVTDVQRQTTETGESHIGLLIDRLRSGSMEMPITASILSVTQARTHAQTNTSNIDSDLMSQSSASTRASAPPRSANDGGLLGGVGSTVGGVVNTTTGTVGNVAGNATGAVGSTVGGTTSATGNLSSSLRELQISQSTSASAQSGSTLSLMGSNLRFESGTTFNLAISNSTNAGKP